MSKTIALEIIQTLAPLSGVFGLRKTNDVLNVGDDVPPSHDWDLENDCPAQNMLTGASTIGLPTVFDDDDLEDVLILVDMMKRYTGNKLILVAGDNAGLGDDNHEVLIKNGVVLLAWDQ